MPVSTCCMICRPIDTVRCLWLGIGASEYTTATEQAESSAQLSQAGTRYPSVRWGACIQPLMSDVDLAERLAGI